MAALECLPIDGASYRPYGALISAGGESVPANQGTAERSNFLSGLENSRPEAARPNVCVYRCSPARANPFPVRLLERHPFSTQIFIPMGGVRRYLAVVALGGEKPDLATLRAFWAGPGQGISYHPGVWHHPMVVLDAPGDMACVVFEDGTEGDCATVSLDEAAWITLP